MNELIIKERNFKEGLVEFINKSELPAFILRPVVEDLLNQIKVAEEAQYKEALSEQTKKAEKEKKKEGK